jgi:7-carboxy-7-deazaguanine synthase
VSTVELHINEIYRSLQGESLAAGLPCTFVRLAGCDLRCRWCDTDYAFHEGRRMTVEAVLEEVGGLGADLVLVTGGEPLLQPAVHALLEGLLADGARVQIETGGHRSLAGIDPRVEIIMDVKCPGSGEEAHNDLDNLAYLKPGDQLKLVIAGRDDYEWARALIEARRLASRCHVILSPVHDGLTPATLAAWILEDRLPVRLGLQLHKVIWPASRRGV